MEEDSSSPKPPKAHNRKPYRGKASSKQHSEKFRERVGMQIMAANTARLDQNLFSNLSTITARLQSFSHEPQAVNATLSQTTRGIGFATARASTWAATIKPQLNIDPNVIYRCSLAQHHYIMTKGTDHGTTYRPSAPNQDFQTEPFLGFSQVIENAQNAKTFNVISAVLSNFGKVTVNREQYVGFTPPNSVAVLIQPNQSEPCKKKRSVQSVGSDSIEVRCHDFPLNPYVVTLRTLRSTVVALSNPETPLIWRQRFIERNPIPGAIYEDGLLMNPDEVMPNNYTQGHMAQDFRRFAAWRDILSKNASHRDVFSTVGLSGSSCISTFAVQYMQARISNYEVVLEAQEFYATKPLSGVQFVAGSLGLVGEIPDSEYRKPDELQTYGARRRQSAIQAMDLYWDNIVDSLLNP